MLINVACTFFLQMCPEVLQEILLCVGLGPEPYNWFDHTSDILMEKFRINTVVSPSRTSSICHPDLIISKGAFLTTKYFYPNLAKASGKIINISSNLGSITSKSS